MAKKVKPGRIIIDDLNDEERMLLAKYGDDEARDYIWAHSVPLAERIAGRFASKYSWVTWEDLLQDILLEVPKIITRYNEDRGTKPAKYLYFCFYRSAQDALRRLDPLGMRFPQRKKHPPFAYLYDRMDADNGPQSHGDGSFAETIAVGYENLLRGYLHNEAFDEKYADHNRPTDAESAD